MRACVCIHGCTVCVHQGPRVRVYGTPCCVASVLLTALTEAGRHGSRLVAVVGGAGSTRGYRPGQLLLIGSWAETAVLVY